MEKTYTEIVATGTYEEILIATRDEIAQQIEDGVLARDLASLTRRLLDIQKELQELAGNEGGDESPVERARREREERRKNGGAA